MTFQPFKKKIIGEFRIRTPEGLFRLLTFNCHFKEAVVELVFHFLLNIVKIVS